ncbi:hypothetical protein [Sphingomonas sp. 3-13AW]|uniref:hypothetical protein n=1 Tax=Sphingomonas sp. 3-13AW TaxID=3050450 RepID=UPI003BB598A4
MIFAILAVTALILPALAAYLAVGIVSGPVLLRVAEHTYDVPIDHLRDTPIAIMCWPRVAADIILAAPFEVQPSAVQDEPVRVVTRLA